MKHSFLKRKCLDTLVRSEILLMPFKLQMMTPCNNDSEKTPPSMDVAPWDENWIKMVLDGIIWYCMVFDGIQWNSMVLHGIQWHCMVLYDIRIYLMVLHGILWYCLVLYDI